MYQAVFFEYPNKYWVRDDIKGWGELTYSPTFYKIDKKGEYITLDGQKATPTQYYSKEDKNLYEKDIDPRTRFLIENYLESDDTPEYHNIVYLDIECEIGGTLTPELIRNAPTKITSISLYKDEIYYCLILDESKSLTKTINNNQKVYPFTSEKELLEAFLFLWKKLDPTIISGWNSGYFDIPFLYYRILRILGEEKALSLSPINKISINEWKTEQPIEIGGINHLDYLLLFKKFTPKQEPSYKLGDIGTKYVNLGKIEYEGSLDRLFKEDVNKFIKYNIRDVEILIELENKFKFINLSVTICHLCHVHYEQIYLSTSLNDGAILTYLKRKGIVSPNKPTTSNPLLKGMEEEYAGGYLKTPVPGLYEWIIDLDFTSLYPSIIRSLNIGIETLLYNVLLYNKYDNNWTLKDLKEKNPEDIVTIQKVNDDKTTTSKEVKVSKLIKLIEDNNLLISASGAIFRIDKPSVVCEVLTDWFNKRSEYKDLMKEAFKRKDFDLGEFYNKRQHAYKIKLNDVYGCYAINGWRYSDGNKIISKAITLTGQRLIQESIKFVNKWMNNQLETDNVDYVITSDTDSLFIQVKDLIKKRHPDIINSNNKEKIIEVILKITSEIQKAANDYINDISKELFNINNNHFFELKQEVILERGYFSGKRRYAMFIVNKEGVPVEELDMKGLDLMKSNMTPIYREFGESLIKDIMFNKPKSEIDQKIIDFNNYIKNKSFDQISKPTGVKKIKEYIKYSPRLGEIFSQLHTKCPINTKGAIFYNDLIKFYKLEKKYPLFMEGDKMKYIQLKNNPYKIEVIGFRGNGEDPDIINKLIDEYGDRELGFESTLLNKLKKIYEDIGWDFVNLNPNINKFFKF